MSLPKPNDAFHWVQAAAGPALVCRPLEPHAAHLFTTRQWPLGTADTGERAAAWGDVARALDVDAAQLSRLHQVHGTSVVVLRRGGSTAPPDQPLPDADIIVSNDPSRALAIQAADCMPLLIADRRSGAVAAAHAGWRGLAGGVLEATIDAMRAPSAIHAWLGPAIGPRVYEVGEEVRAAFLERDAAVAAAFAATRSGHWLLDLYAVARQRLARLGVERVYGGGLCTYSDPERFYSYRRDRAAGRMAALIWLS